MIAHFAIVRDNSSRWNRDAICQLQIPHIEDDKDYTYTKCRGYCIYGAGKLIVSEVITVQLDIVEDVQAEIDSCNELIAAAHREFADKLDYVLEPIKARRTELMQISHQPKHVHQEIESASNTDDWTSEGDDDAMDDVDPMDEITGGDL